MLVSVKRLTVKQTDLTDYQAAGCKEPNLLEETNLLDFFQKSLIGGK